MGTLGLESGCSDAASAQEWPDWQGVADMLAESKEEIHMSLEGTAERAEVSRIEPRRLGRFIGLTDIDVHHMLLIHDKFQG